ncbi:MAG: Gfo/Idh/MocA family oxidoreductase [Lachnospiraceae bacterium]|nr:Gfo/Idh/MocA family oxidoreductase [Lachnospiraceae bacterium]
MKKVGVIGCGRISEQYLTNMTKFYKNIEVVGCSDANIENAKKRAEQFGIKAMTNEELLADPAIDIVVVLVPTPIHATLIEQALKAGKNVYTEKTMTATLEEAEKVMKLADEKGLYFGAAPDTFMGAAYQTARKAIDDGLIGEPISFSMNINRNLDFMASLFEFLRLPGGGFAYDYGVYYLTAMVALFGPAKDIYSVVKNKAVDRINCAPMSPDFGKPYKYDNESQIYALVNMENGMTGTISMNGDSNLMDDPFFLVYGTKGILKLSCANDFGGEVEYRPSPTDWTPAPAEILKNNSPIVGEHRGIGPAEMALSIEAGKKNRASKEMAYHVLDIISQMMKSSETKQVIEIKSTCERPAALTVEELSQMVDM